MRRSTREHIVEAADELFYRQGYEHTSFADIAGAVKISRGNFYYHFRTKDEILDAVIDARLAATARMLAEWEQEGQSPAARIRCFVRILTRNRARIMDHGCPVGTLSAELAKLDHAAQPRAAEIFTLFRDWLRGQFEAMGRAGDADELALHLLAMSQGVAVLASAYRDTAFVEREVARMCAWVDGCAAGSETIETTDG